MFEEEEMCECLECGLEVHTHEMRTAEGKLCYHNKVCQDCYKELESDD